MTTLTNQHALVLDLPGWLRAMFEDATHGMRIEEFADGHTLVVRADLPGLDLEKDVDVSVHDGVLVITAERTASANKEEDGYIRSELRYGRTSRSIPLPVGTDARDVNATYKDGVLEVRITTQATPLASQKVPVRRG